MWNCFGKKSSKNEKKDLLKPDIVALIPTFGDRTGGYLWVWGQPVRHSETLSWKSIYMYEHTVSSSVFLSFIYSFMDFIQVEYLYLKFLGPKYLRFQIFKNILGIYVCVYIYMGIILRMRFKFNHETCHLKVPYTHQLRICA